MADPAPRAFLPVPPGYWDLPEEERLALAEKMAGQIQEDLTPDTVD
jgi:hypothetical protein